MMTILIESLIGIVLFTVVIVSVTLKNPLTSVGDYPPAIKKRCIELGLPACLLVGLYVAMHP